jgi:hypothetical protein
MESHAMLNIKRNWHVERCDVLDGLRMLPDGCINAVVTSPPYYALRSYLPADHPDKHLEHGSEPTPEAFIATMVEVFTEVRRVLRDDGVCWMNLGDSYNQYNGNRGPAAGLNVSHNDSMPAAERGLGAGELKPGDKLNMPHRVAEALQAAGWYWRDTVIWHKKSPMPESVSGWKWTRCKVKVKAGAVARMGERTGSGFDYRETELAEWTECPGCAKCKPNDGWVLRRGSWRCTQAHEYVFMFAKSPDYFCDGEAAKEKAVGGTPGNKTHKLQECRVNGKPLGIAGGLTNMTAVERANPRNVLSLAHEPTKEKHFAAYPSELVHFCLKPSIANAYCDKCGAPHAPMVLEERVATRPALTNKIWKHDDGDHVGQRSDDSPNLDPERHIKRTTVVGYKPSCGCNAGTTSGIVMDPYCGTGTTGRVALKLGARFLGFELNPEYKAIADRQAKKKLPLFT